MYRIGYPFWKLAARVGIPISIPVIVEHDEEANVYIATSHNMRGLVVEASSMDELLVEVNDVVSMLMEEEIHNNHTNASAVFKYRGRPIITA